GPGDPRRTGRGGRRRRCTARSAPRVARSGNALSSALRALPPGQPCALPRRTSFGEQGQLQLRGVVGPPAYLSLLGLVAGTALGLLLPGAWAGLPDGNWPGGKLAFDGAIRSSSCSI